jgi:hypothetical protein
VPTILLAVAVVFHFKQALVSIPRQAQNWLILGIVIAFVGQSLDNLYWGFAWTGDFLSWPDTESWFLRGSLFNIFSRQICGIAAALCHIKAAVLWGSASREWVGIVYLISAIGMLLSGGLLIFVRVFVV